MAATIYLHKMTTVTTQRDVTCSPWISMKDAFDTDVTVFFDNPEQAEALRTAAETILAELRARALQAA